LPNIKDVPVHQTVLVRDAWGPAPFDGQAIGEHSASPTAPAIVNAIYDAIGIQLKETPITAEKIHNALRPQSET
jgi:nicotinate dehydrogenase medium molybdopterin subunit